MYYCTVYMMCMHVFIAYHTQTDGQLLEFNVVGGVNPAHFDKPLRNDFSVEQC